MSRPGDTPPPPPPPPPPSGANAPPPPGWTPAAGPTNVYTFEPDPPGAVATASYGARAAAFALDAVLLLILPVVALWVVREGEREIRECDLTADGQIAVFGEDRVTTGLCEFPSSGSIAMSVTLLLAGVLLWFGLVAREGRTGRTPGKSLLGIQTVDRRTGDPLGAGRGIGRGLLRGVLGWPTLGVGFVIDHLWPLWDRDDQTLHDKAVGAVVVPAARPGATTGAEEKST